MASVGNPDGRRNAVSHLMMEPPCGGVTPRPEDTLASLVRKQSKPAANTHTDTHIRRKEYDSNSFWSNSC